MNHIDEARMNLQAELQTAEAHVELIRGALQTLDRIKPSKAVVSFEHEIKASAEKRSLPKTGAEFWLSHMPLNTATKTEEIFRRASETICAYLEYKELPAADKKLLQQRMANYLASLTKSKHVKHLGPGQYKRVK